MFQTSINIHGIIQWDLAVQHMLVFDPSQCLIELFNITISDADITFNKIFEYVIK